MISEQSTIFPKQIKFDDYGSATQQNLIRIMQTSNLLLGNGGRSSLSSIIMSKCLHFLQDQSIINFLNKNIWEFGSGVGLLGIYLGWIGANVILSDLPQLKNIIQGNINLNKQMIKGSISFVEFNWKNGEKTNKQNGNAITTFDKFSKIEGVDWTLACECGGLEDLQLQLKWMGKQGMIVGFMEHDYTQMDDSLNSRQLEQYLLAQQYEYQRIQNYHPDYVDQRVFIYKIWK